MKISKKILLTALSALLVLSMVACGGKSASSLGSYIMKDDYYYSTSSVTNSFSGDKYSASDSYIEAEEPGYYESDSSYYGNAGEDYTGKEVFNDSARKLIKTYNISLETEDFDELVNAISARINALGGYVENLQNSNGTGYNYKNLKRAHITARIPAKNADNFVNFVGESANVTNNSLYVEDVTLNYVDMESRKATYEIEQTRLLDLLQKADNLNDILVIEQRLSEVRYQLESMASRLRAYDNLVDYSTINLDISEVKQYTAPEPETFGEKVSRAFSEGIGGVWSGMKNFTIGFVGALPGLVVFAIFVTIIVFLIRGIVKGAKKRKAKKLEQRIASMNQQRAEASNTAENK